MFALFYYDQTIRFTPIDCKMCFAYLDRRYSENLLYFFWSYYFRLVRNDCTLKTRNIIWGKMSCFNYVCASVRICLRIF
ncbi:hypothetical protein R3W88_012867 [Solanum pinnatisectum]|uniref:Uncharacterized protein n=1 Tax=Solanum pinnatisectum TaxID=50273 RepID=A0AAV9LAG1_9SOLN|nr:hypothetical protein R3W88_012867 [Solanum pinnatisectum]